jgi:hypothetical protein
VRRGPRFAPYARPVLRPGLSLVVLLLAGCAHLEVQDLGDGRHALTATSPSGGYYGAHEEAVERANEYCRRYRQTGVIERFEDLPALGLQGEHTSRVVFTCAASQALHF